MKVKKFKFKQILKLHLIKSRVYENSAKKNDSNFLGNNGLAQTMANFKKVLQIIFKYHQIEKKILFVGFPTKLEFRINKLTKHVAVPANFDLQSIFSNNNSKSLKINKNKKHSFSNTFVISLLPKLKKTPDLIVLFSSEKKQNILSESYIAKIPVIVFDNDSSVKNNLKSKLYYVQGLGNSLSVISNKNLFFIGLNFLFKTFNRKKLEVHKTGISKSLGSNFQAWKKRF